jgi:hypothetical protein
MIDITWPVLPLYLLYSIHHTHNNTALLNLIRTSHRMSWRASFYFSKKFQMEPFLRSSVIPLVAGPLVLGWTLGDC